MTVKVKFWGVRGSIPCTSPQFARYGGNTMCTEVNFDGYSIAIDMGTGARLLGQHVQRAATLENPLDMHVLFSHFHLDHVIGLPFFAPLYQSFNRITLYGTPQTFGHPPIKKCLSKLISPPYFPIPLEHMPARVDFVDFEIGDVLTPFGYKPDIRVQTVSSPHPDGCVSFRLDYQGQSIGVLCDFMPSQNAKVNDNIKKVMDSVDILVFDAAFTPEQYETKQTWGHASWRHAIDWKQQLSAQKALLVHHDIVNDDDFIDAQQDIVRSIDPEVRFVCEGQQWTLDQQVTVAKQKS